MNGVDSTDRRARAKLLLALAAPMGILTAAALVGVELVLHQGGPPGDVSALVIKAVEGVLIGVAIAVMLGLVQWRNAVRARDRRLALDPTASPAVQLRARAEGTAAVDLPARAVLFRGADLATALGTRRFLLDEPAGTLTVTTRLSLESWGERVVLTVGPEQPGATTVRVTSRNRHPAQILDQGRNARNVERVTAWLATL